MRKELKAAGRLKYGQELRDLKKERRVERSTQKRNDGWFDEYQTKLAGIQGASGENYARAGEQLASQSAAGAAANTARTAGLDAQRSADAGRYGALSAPVANAAGAAAANQTSREGAQRGVLAAQGAANFDYLGGRQHAAAGSQLASRIASRGRQEVLREETRGVKKDRQDFKVDLRRELRGAERQFLSDLLANKLDNQGQALAELTQAEASDLAERQLLQDASEAELDREAEEEAEKAAEAEDEPKKKDWRAARSAATDLISDEWRANSDDEDSTFKTPRSWVNANRDRILSAIKREVEIKGERLPDGRARSYLDRWLRDNKENNSTVGDGKEGTW